MANVTAVTEEEVIEDTSFIDAGDDVTYEDNSQFVTEMTSVTSSDIPQVVASVDVISDFLEDTINETIGTSLFSEVKDLPKEPDKTSVIKSMKTMCYICGIVKTDRASMKTHLMIHYSIIKPISFGKPREWQCVTCKLTFGSF